MCQVIVFTMPDGKEVIGDTVDCGDPKCGSSHAEEEPEDGD